MNKEEWTSARLARQDQLRRDKRVRSPIARLVGVEIFSNSNFELGGSFHAETTMAATLGVNVKSVKRALPELVAAGYIKVEKRGRCNFYEIVFADRIGDIKSPIKSSKGDKKDTDRGHFRPEIGDTSGPLTLKDNSEENSKSPADLDLKFEEWFAAFPRRAGERQARREFERIVRTGMATFEQLIFGAENYAAERAGQDSRYTKKPANWLKDEGWRDEPLMSADRSSRGGGYAIVAAKLRARGVDDGWEEETRHSARDLQSNLAAVLADEQKVSSAAVQVTSQPLVVRPAAPKRPPREDPKRGQHEMEIRAALGSDVFDDLSEPLIADLCRRWPAKKVSLAELEKLKLEHAQAQSTGPAAAAGRAAAGSG